MGTDAANASHHSKKYSRPHDDTDAAEYKEKYNRYEADYVRRVNAKYFSKNTLNGGIIFDKETVVDNEVIRASRVPPTKSFLDAPCLGEENKSSTSAADPSSNASNRKSQSRKNI
ncbi:hypothetical protein SUGI_0901970 [Cryptomeria japonica]|uniref:uncharacterized protein LOC131060224 isoform X2 n=1 Tax=Cryptomeria japonica TaxID=3369 RepID=UPI0024147248|nr:uncharacterized protein LOC131060224 isoform X2 [Cryptomeria japonica]GLJ43409.1 hypothetical protein SUGI_0901970 [Cryptomeria japonica]